MGLGRLFYILLGFRLVFIRDLGLRDRGFRDLGLRDLGFRDLGFRESGFRDIYMCRAEGLGMQVLGIQSSECFQCLGFGVQVSNCFGIRSQAQAQG